MAGTFHLQQSKNGQFYFSLKAGNGEVILSSEQYEAKASAQHGIESVKANAAQDARYKREVAKKGEHYFVLRAANHKVIGRSETYSSAAAMESGIAAVKKNAPGAKLKDSTEA